MGSAPWQVGSSTSKSLGRHLWGWKTEMDDKGQWSISGECEKLQGCWPHRRMKDTLLLKQVPLHHLQHLFIRAHNVRQVIAQAEWFLVIVTYSHNDTMLVRNCNESIPGKGWFSLWNTSRPSQFPFVEQTPLYREIMYYHSLQKRLVVASQYWQVIWILQKARSSAVWIQTRAYTEEKIQR